MNFEDSLSPRGRARVDTFQVASINYFYCTKGRNRSYLLFEGSTSVEQCKDQRGLPNKIQFNLWFSECFGKLVLHISYKIFHEPNSKDPRSPDNRLHMHVVFNWAAGYGKPGITQIGYVQVGQSCLITTISCYWLYLSNDIVCAVVGVQFIKWNIDHITKWAAKCNLTMEYSAVGVFERIWDIYFANMTPRATMLMCHMSA